MSGSSQTMVGEKEELRARLEEGRRRFLDCVHGVSEEGARFSPGDGKWSILQVAEHVAVAERQMLAMWFKLAAPGTSPKQKDQVVIANLGDRNKKNPSPDPSVPTGRFSSLREAIASFVASREKTMAALSSSEDMRSKVVVHPLSGIVDGHQLFLIMAMHPLRHAYQVEEIKSSAGFRK